MNSRRFHPRQRASHISRQIGNAISYVAFCTAIVLPIAYIPSLVLIQRTSFDLSVFLGAVALNAGALVIGHGFQPKTGETGTESPSADSND